MTRKTHEVKVPKDIDFIQVGGNPTKPSKKNLKPYKIRFRYKKGEYQGYTAYTKNNVIIGKNYKYWTDKQMDAYEGYLLYGKMIIRKRGKKVIK